MQPKQVLKTRGSINFFRKHQPNWIDSKYMYILRNGILKTNLTE